MTDSLRCCTALNGRLAYHSPWNSSRGSQLLEFSFALIILMLLVMGGWDFGYAYMLKQKLTNAAREGARVLASNSLINPDSCTSTNPCTIVAGADAVVQYLNQAGLKASCISPDSPTSVSGLQYTYTCSNGISLIINRGVSLTEGTQVLPETEVTLSYPMTWILKGLLPNGTFPSTISTTVYMLNLA